MDLQTFLSNAVAAERANIMKRSDQLTLGEMILKMEAIYKTHADNVATYGEPTVVLDFEYFFPTGIDSWRGSYSELALGFSTYESDKKPMKVSEFLSILKDANGKEFTGYKGGEFLMGIETPVWVANYGKSGNTAVIEIVDDRYRAIIMTGYREL